MPLFGGQRRAVRRSQLAGIPCFWLRKPPPFTASLIFRVGRSDETLVSGGVTHLAEHLAMPAAPPRDIDRNARVEDVFTVFWATGRKARVVRFLADVAAALREPRFDRLETERAILQTEARGGGTGSVGGSMALRYGARGHGLIGFDEYGLSWLGEPQIREWIESRFVARNAALWMTDEPPRELQLELELAVGHWFEPAEPLAIRGLALPSIYGFGPPATVVASFEFERSVAANVAMHALIDRAWRVLRYERGLVYSIDDWYEPLTGSRAHLTLTMECLEHNVGAVAGDLRTILEQLAHEGPTDSERRDDLEAARESIQDPETVEGDLHYAAVEELFGQPARSRESLVREREELSTTEITSAADALVGSLLLLLPDGTPAPERLHAYPTRSDVRVSGRRFRGAALPLGRTARKTRLVVGGEGVMVEDPEGETGIRFDECAALLRWPRGERTLWSEDGTYIVVDPNDWRGGREAIDAIDRRVPGELVVPMEPDLGQRIEQIEAVAAQKLTRRWVISDELAALPEELEDGEELLSLAEANRRLRAGLIVATDRRLLWLCDFVGRHRLEYAYDDLDNVTAKRAFLEAKLVVRARGDEITFSDIVPRERAPEIAEIARERIRDASGTRG